MLKCTCGHRHFWHGELLNGKQPCMVYGCECSDYEPNGWVYNESFDEV